MSRGQLLKESRLQQLVTRLRNANQKLKQFVFELKETVNAQQKEINKLKDKLQDKELQRKQLASYLFKQGRKSNGHKKLGKRCGTPAFHRQTPKDEEVTERREFELSNCPTCKHKLEKPTDESIKYEEDIDLAPRKIIKKFVIFRYWCPVCKEFVKSNHVPPITRIGPNAMAYILYSRYRLRLPQEKIKESLKDLHNFKISDGEISEKLQEAESLFGKDYQAICELVKEAKVVYGDETGWRMNGENWWLWVFATEKGTRYVLSETRGKGIAEEALGKETNETNKDRVIVSDGYAVYAKLPGENQQCWIHLLRTAKLFSIQLYEDLLKLYLKLGDELLKPKEQRNPSLFEKYLQTILEKQYEQQTEKVKNRIRKHRQSLLTCLHFDNVLPENNTAERAIRNHVVMRKIFGGCRSPDGARAHEVNTSVIETALKQNPDSSFFDVIIPLVKKRIEDKQGRSYSDL